MRCDQEKTKSPSTRAEQLAAHQRYRDSQASQDSQASPTVYDNKIDDKWSEEVTIVSPVVRTTPSTRADQLAARQRHWAVKPVEEVEPVLAIPMTKMDDKWSEEVTIQSPAVHKYW
jgi:hypothetical protein